MDYRSYFDREYIGSWDLGGKDVTVVIDRCEGRTLNNGKQKNKKPVLFFVGKEKGLALNKTMAKVVAAMYGNDVAAWAGKRVTLYPTTTTFGSETIDCIRIRPSVPNGKKPAGDFVEGAEPSKELADAVERARSEASS